MGTLNPLEIFPLEVWKIIFKNLEDQQGFSENLLSCSRVCATFQNVLEPTQCQWLFEPISQFVFPYLCTRELLKCRIICKEWCRVADNFLEEKNLETHRPFNKDTTDISRSPQNKYYPPESRTCLTRIFSISEFLDPTEPVGKSPFIGRSLLLEDEEYYEDEVSDNEPPALENIKNSFWKKSSELILMYGEHIKDIELKPGYDSVNAAEFYQNLRQFLPFIPNLRSLTISGGLQVLRSFQHAGGDPEIEDSISLPQIPCLESLEINCEGLPRAIFCGKLISGINPSKLKCLKLNLSLLPADEEQFFEVKEPLPSLTELHLTGMDVSEYVKFMLEDIISREAPLGKLVLSFDCYANDIEFGHLEAINTFGGTLQMLSVEAKRGLRRDATTGIDTPYLERLERLRTPHLRSLEVSWDWRAVESGFLASRLAQSLEYLHISHVVDPNRVFPNKGDLGVVFHKQHSYAELYPDLWDEMLKLKVITVHIESYSITCTKEFHEQSMKKFGELQWNELTPTLQKELLGKLQISGRPFMNFDEILPINSKAINRLISSEKEETLLQKVIQDYYQGKKQSNGKISWSDLDNSLRIYLTSKLRESSQVDSLELEQVPLSSNTLVHLIKEKGDNPGFLGKIVYGYVDEMVEWSLALANDLYKVALLEYINREVIGCLEIHFQNPQAVERLVEVGMLRKKVSKFEAYAFSHDSVRHCIIGMMMRRLIGWAEIGRMNVFKLFLGGYMSPNPLGLYFADYMSEVKEGHLAYYSFYPDNTLTNLFVTLSVMRLPSMQPVIAVLEHFNNNVLDNVLSRKLPEDMSLTLLHVAAIRGDLERVKCLLYEFGFSKELAHPRFRNLMLACVENTKDCQDEQIQQRKEIINELLKLNGDLVNYDVPSGSLNVHISLIKFMLELGEDSWFTLAPKV